LISICSAVDGRPSWPATLEIPVAEMISSPRMSVRMESRASLNQNHRGRRGHRRPYRTTPAVHQRRGLVARRTEAMSSSVDSRNFSETHTDGRTGNFSRPGHHGLTPRLAKLPVADSRAVSASPSWAVSPTLNGGGKFVVQHKRSLRSGPVSRSMICHRGPCPRFVGPTSAGFVTASEQGRNVGRASTPVARC